jgi:hypothetical protein
MYNTQILNKNKHGFNGIEFESTHLEHGNIQYVYNIDSDVLYALPLEYSKWYGKLYILENQEPETVNPYQYFK